MLTFERTHNHRWIKLFMTQQQIWPHIGDDFAPSPEEWEPNPDPRIWYVMVIQKAEIIGLLAFFPRSTVLWEVHIALARDRTSRGTAILAGALRWLFENSTAERAVAEVPACNRLAVRLARKTMHYLGVNEKSFKKHGELQDLVLFGLSKCPH